jgi:hypothetical protein
MKLMALLGSGVGAGCGEAQPAKNIESKKMNKTFLRILLSRFCVSGQDKSIRVE